MPAVRPVFSFWTGGRLTSLAAASIRSFTDLGHPYVLYAYDEVQGLPGGVTLRDAEEIILRRKLAYLLDRNAYALASNVFRYTYLLQGGLWVDTDVFALRAFDFALDELVFGWQDADLLNVAVFGAPPNAMLVEELHRRSTSARATRAWMSSLPRRRRLEHRMRVLRHGRNLNLAEAPWGTFGPLLLTKTAHDLGLTGQAQPLEAFYPIPWQQADLLLERASGWTATLSPESYAVHVWNSILERNGISEAPAGSLLEHLISRANSAAA